MEGYIALLERLLELQLVESVPPVQLTIRLLVPAGSYLLKLPGFTEKLMAFDPRLLGYPWAHPDPRVDRLQQNLQAEVARCEQEGVPRREVFAAIWVMAHETAARSAPKLPGVPVRGAVTNEIPEHSAGSRLGVAGEHSAQRYRTIDALVVVRLRRRTRAGDVVAVGKRIPGADLETRAIRRATTRLSQVDLSELDRLLGEMQAASEAGDLPALLDADIAFHRKIVRAAGWPQLQRRLVAWSS